MAALEQSGNSNFAIGTNIDIPLNADGVTDKLLISGGAFAWALQPSNFIGTLNGSPTYTLQSSITGDLADFYDYDPNFAKDIAITNALKDDEVQSQLFFRVKVTANDNTAASTTCEFIIKGIV